MIIRHYVLSEKGSKHITNEDNYSYPQTLPNQKEFISQLEDKGLLYIVCDGIGGHNAGEEASKMAAVLTQEAFNKTDDPQNRLKDIIKTVNKEILRKSFTSPELEGMGTTLVALLVRKDKAYFFNVGDSRAYLYNPSGSFQQITEDHSLVWQDYKKGIIKKDDILDDVRNNIITRALGIGLRVEVDSFAEVLPHEFMILLCSDGLTDFLTDRQIKDVIEKGRGLKNIAQKLKEEALAEGSDDDITIMLVSNES